MVLLGYLFRAFNSFSIKMYKIPDNKYRLHILQNTWCLIKISLRHNILRRINFLWEFDRRVTIGCTDEPSHQTHRDHKTAEYVGFLTFYIQRV